MQNSSNLLDPLMERVEEYGKSSIELIKLKLIDKLSLILAMVFTNFILFLFFVLFISALNIAISLWLGKFLGETYLGFLCVSAFYLFLGLICYLFGAKIILRNFKRKMIHQFLI